MFSRASRAFTILVAALVVAPTASAIIAGNGVTARVDADESALAACQVVILVRAVIVLDTEDRLGLATGDAAGPAVVHAPGGAAFNGTLAECRVLVRNLRVTFPDEATAARAASSYVSGPAPVSNASVAAAANAWNVRVTHAGSAVAVCQFIVLIDSIVIGGGAYGLPTGDAPQVLVAPAHPADTGAHARCDARVDDVEVTHA